MIHFCVFYSPAFASRAQVCVDSIRRFHHNARVHEIPLDSNASPGQYIQGFHKFRFKWIRDFLPSIDPWDRVVFVGADCVFYGRATPFLEMAEVNQIVIVPHVVYPPRERVGSLYVTGHANGDLFSFSPQSAPALDWLLQQDMTNNIRGGIFYEQTHLSSLPFIADGVAIYRRPDVNVAWFNLNERALTQENGRYMVNGVPLVMAHFTGYNKGEPGRLSRYSNRTIPSGTALESLFREYDARI